MHIERGGWRLNSWRSSMFQVVRVPFPTFCHGKSRDLPAWSERTSSTRSPSSFTAPRSTHKTEQTNTIKFNISQNIYSRLQSSFRDLYCQANKKMPHIPWTAASQRRPTPFYGIWRIYFSLTQINPRVIQLPASGGWPAFLYGWDGRSKRRIDGVMKRQVWTEKRT